MSERSGAATDRCGLPRRLIALDSAVHPVSVALVDDCPLVTAGLAALLEPFAGRVQVSQDGRVPARGTADVILFDAFGRPDAAELLQELQASTGSKVLIYAWVVDPDQLSRFVQLGASGFVSKGSSADALVRAVEQAHSGMPVCVETTPGPPPMPAWPDHEAELTEREAQVVALITLGMTNREIASRCYLSINTVKTHIRTAYRKMGVKNRSSAVLWGLEHGPHTHAGGSADPPRQDHPPGAPEPRSP